MVKFVALGRRMRRDVKDPRVINMLVSKGQQELEESLMQWKQKTHLIQSLTPDRNQAHMFDKVNSDFLTKFYQGME